jgi:hypothetical protein
VFLCTISIPRLIRFSPKLVLHSYNILHMKRHYLRCQFLGSLNILCIVQRNIGFYTEKEKDNPVANLINEANQPVP